MKQVSRGHPQYSPNEPILQMYNQFIQPQQHLTLMPLTNTEPPIELPKQYPAKQRFFKQEQSRPREYINSSVIINSTKNKKGVREQNFFPKIIASQSLNKLVPSLSNFFNTNEITFAILL